MCPLSKGSHCPHTSENGLPHFENEDDLERARNVPNLRKLVGCIGCSEFPNGGPHHARFAGIDHLGVGGVVGGGIRTSDSGVGESLEGMTVSSGYSNPYASLTTAQAPGGGGGGVGGDGARFGSYESREEVGADFEDEFEDTVQPLRQDVEQHKRYEQKKAIGAQFLTSGITPQQIAQMSPELKASMDNFINQLETHVRIICSGNNDALLLHVLHQSFCYVLRMEVVKWPCGSLSLSTFVPL